MEIIFSRIMRAIAKLKKFATLEGAVTLSIKIFSIMALSITTFRITIKEMQHLV
jgi:hypothetical protein